MHSPSRKVTAKEQAEWKIPPCISNWKNPRGYTIPLDKRVAADGRGLQTVHINENFAKLAEALYTADRKAREAVTMREQIERKVASKERERKEEQLQKIAMEARAARAGIRRGAAGADDDETGVSDRDQLRRERARDRAHDRNLTRSGADGKVKGTRDRDRDISEQIALGMPNPRASGSNTDSMFDQRLFNQSRGMDSGFAGGTLVFVFSQFSPSFVRLIILFPSVKVKMTFTTSTISPGEQRLTLVPISTGHATRITTPMAMTWRPLANKDSSCRSVDSPVQIGVATLTVPFNSSVAVKRIPSTSVPSLWRPKRQTRGLANLPCRPIETRPTGNGKGVIKIVSCFTTPVNLFMSCCNFLSLLLLLLQLYIYPSCAEFVFLIPFTKPLHSSISLLTCCI